MEHGEAARGSQPKANPNAIIHLFTGHSPVRVVMRSIGSSVAMSASMGGLVAVSASMGSLVAVSAKILVVLVIVSVFWGR